jgi:hypothetical protein
VDFAAGGAGGAAGFEHCVEARAAAKTRPPPTTRKRPLRISISYT